MTSRGSVALGLHTAAEGRPDLVDVMELAAGGEAPYEIDHAVRSGPVDDEVDDLLAHHRVGVLADESRQLGAALDVVRCHARRRASVQRALGCEVGVGLVLADRLRVLPLLGVGRVTRPDEPLGLMLQLLVGPGTDLVATAIHGLLLSSAAPLPARLGPQRHGGAKTGHRVFNGVGRRTAAIAGGTGMGTAVRSGATAAALLPSALAGAILVSAPFAGTTTSPLANSTTRAARSTTGHSAATTGGSSGLSFDISPASIAILGAAEMLLLGVGAGVIVMARRSRAEEA